MFTALNPPSPGLDLAYSDNFSDASRSDSGINDAESGLPHAGYYGDGSVGDMGGGVEAGMNHAEGVLVSGTDLPLPSPSPNYNNYYHTHLPYVPQSQHEQAYHLSSTSAHSQVESRSSLVEAISANLAANSGTTLGSYPELYSQFLPHPSTSSNYSDPAPLPIPSSAADVNIASTPFPPSPSRVYSTSKALHAAVSHPLMRTQSHSDSLSTAYARPHPYARLQHSASFSSNPHTISRSASTASLRHISGTSTGSGYSTLSMPPPPPYHYRTQPQRSISSLSGYSSSSFSRFGVSAGSNSEYSLSQSASRSTSGSGSDGDHYQLDTPTTSFLQVQQGTSRYFPPSAPGVFRSYGAAGPASAGAALWMVKHKSAYLPQGAEAHSAMNVGTEHLYTSGPGPISGPGPDEETRRIEDEATWRIIKGNGIMGGGDSDDDDDDAEEADEEEYESVRGGGDGVDGETTSRYLDDQAISPGTSNIGDETESPDLGTDCDTEADIPPASRIQPIPPRIQPTATSTPLPCPPTLQLVLSQDPPKPKKKPSKAWSGSKRRSRVGRGTVGVEVFTVPKGGNEFVERRREEALRLGLSSGLEVEPEAEAEDDVWVEEKEVKEGERDDALSEDAALTVPTDKVDAISIPIPTHSPIPIPAPAPTEETGNGGITLARSGLRNRRHLPIPLPALIPSPAPSVPKLPSPPVPEVDYHPSGRPKRSTVFTIKTEYPAPDNNAKSTAEAEVEDDDESEDGSEGDDGEDERDNYSDTGDRESREATPLWSLGRSQTRSRKAGSPFVVRRGNNSGAVRRHHADPEVRAKVESLRKRLLDPEMRTGNFDEKLCQLLADPRFSDLTGWSEDGEKIVIPDFEAFWTTASPYVMRTQTKRSAFDKQLSNHGFKRETSNDTGTKVRKTLHHPALSEGDTILWSKVGKLEQLTKWGKGSKSSQSSNTTSRTTLRHLVAVRDSTIEELTERVEALQLEKDKSLGQFCAQFPQLWTEDNVMAIFNLGPSDIPAHLALPPPSPCHPTSPLLIKPDIPKVEIVNPASGSGTGAKKVVRKRSRQGDLVAAAKMEEGIGAEQTLELVVEVETEGEVAVERKTVSRKRSKLVLAKGGRK